MQGNSDLPASFQAAGVDYLTVTSRSSFKQKKLQSFLADLLDEERNKGNSLHKWFWEGYSGFRCGSVMGGSRHDGTIARISSDAALAHWRKTLGIASNVTRLDYQVTFKLDSDPDQKIKLLHRKAMRHPTVRSKFRRVSLIEDSKRGCTLMLGSRESEKYMRGYNKFTESGLEHHRNCLRLETEFKGETAYQAAELLAQTQDDVGAGVGWIAAYAGRFGINLPQVAASCLPFGGPSRATDCDRTVLWLREQCSRSVRRLIDAGRLAEVIAALGLSDHVRPIY